MASINDLVSPIFGPWLVTAALLLGLMISLIGAVYVIAGLLLNDRMKLWAKMELTELFYSVVLISLAVVALPYLDGVTQGALNIANPGTTAVQGATTTIAHPPIPNVPTSAYIRTGSGPTDYQAMDICGTAIEGVRTYERGGSATSDSTSIYSGVKSCNVRLGIWYLRQLYDEEKNLAFKVYLDYIWASTIQEFTVNVEFIFEKAGFLNFNPWRGFYAVGNSIRSTVFDWAVKLMMLAKFQETILYFIATGLFPVMFIAGAVMRAFIFTRRLGGLLLGLSLSLYFIFPSFYAFAALNMLQIKNELRPAWEADNNANPHHTPDPPIGDLTYMNGQIFMPGAQGGTISSTEAQDELTRVENQNLQQTLLRMQQSGEYMPSYRMGSSEDYRTSAGGLTRARAVLKGMSDTFNAWIDKLTGFFKYDLFMDRAFLRNGPIDSLARLTFWSVFFSFLSILATIAAARSLSMTFGGDIEIAGLTRLI